ncbi:hypothetical protein XENORESO_000566, partial [Xenotaenia resolanae]
VPGDLSQTSDDPSLSDFETAHRALINVWIPSVFLQGRAANTYHVYQVRQVLSGEHLKLIVMGLNPFLKIFYFEEGGVILLKEAILTGVSTGTLTGLLLLCDTLPSEPALTSPATGATIPPLLERITP